MRVFSCILELSLTLLQRLTHGICFLKYLTYPCLPGCCYSHKQHKNLFLPSSKTCFGLLPNELFTFSYRSISNELVIFLIYTCITQQNDMNNWVLFILHNKWQNICLSLLNIFNVHNTFCMLSLNGGVQTRRAVILNEGWLLLWPAR